MQKIILQLPTPITISIWWNGGSLLGFVLISQILTGIFLSIHYRADIISSFYSVSHLIRDVSMGWIFRMLHANGASFFFLILYFHIGRGLYYKSFKSQPKVWSRGISIFLICIATAFLGYVLPWGQISFWGATVITNLLSAIPFFGKLIVEWIWGGFSVNQATLGRFYSLHFILPFLIAFLRLIHVYFLHEKGSSNPLGGKENFFKLSFSPYFTWKDIVGFLVLILCIFFVVFFFPTVFTDPENFKVANEIETPEHIQPEWYFLFAYAILRSIPNKLGGVVAIFSSILILFVLLFSFNKEKGSFRIKYQFIFWVLVVNFILLSWLGACPVEEPFILVGQVISIIYFSLFFILRIFVLLGKLKKLSGS